MRSLKRAFVMALGGLALIGLTQSGSASVSGPGTQSVPPNDALADLFYYQGSFAPDDDADGRVRINQGGGGFAYGPLNTTFNKEWFEPVPGFYNNDSYEDMLFYNGDTAVSVILFAVGDGTWTSGPVLNDWGKTTVYSGNFNSDGLTDILEYRATNGYWRVRLADGDGTWTTFEDTSFPEGVSIVTGDFNGDALTDVSFFGFPPFGSGVQPVMANGSGGWSFGALRELGTGYTYYTGNFNDDAFDDLFAYNHADTGFVAFSDGVGGLDIATPNDTFAPGWEVYTGNFNTDNLTDLFLYNGSASVHTSTTLLADGNGDWNTGPVSNGLEWAGWDKIVSANFNGDAFTDLYLYTDDGLDAFLFGDGAGGWTTGLIPQQQMTWEYIVPGRYGGAVTPVTPTPTLSHSPTPVGQTPSPTPVPTDTPSPTPEGQTPGPTPTPSPTPTPTPEGQTPGPTPEGQQVVWGDANCSGTPDPIDSLLTLRHNAGLSANTAECPAMGTNVALLAGVLLWGDVDCSADISPVDSLKLLRFDAGLSVSQGDSCPVIGSEVTIAAQ